MYAEDNMEKEIVTESKEERLKELYETGVPEK